MSESTRGWLERPVDHLRLVPNVHVFQHETQMIAGSVSEPTVRYVMDEENFTSVKVESCVQQLQALLFPISPRRSVSDSFLSSFFLKGNTEDLDEDRLAHVVKLKQPKDYIFKELDAVSQPPRWPTECQVLEEKIEHISYVPPSPEFYYTTTNSEVQPKPVGEEYGTVVYQYYPISAVNYFSRSSVGGSRYLLPTCPCPDEDCLKFESRFESGNLAKAIKITATYYELHLRTDLYTNRHTQWFYFRVTNMKKYVAYRFSLVNLNKEESLYNDGMKVLMYSVKDAKLHSIGWRRCGDNITYFYNENVTSDDPDQQMLHTLTFTVEFPHEEDTVYFAHSYPYTYADLQKHLHELASHPVKSTFTTLRLLCRTLACNNVYYVTITSPPTTNGANVKKKQAIVVTARVHPGETPSSWMMKGFLDYLTGDSASAKELRDKFIFKLVPMLNPDGVIVGNNRCSLAGRDLNRQYRTVIRETYPSIWYTKLMIRRLMEECGVAMYCDLHGHSRKHNIFIYGCESKRGTESCLYEQVFPLMLHKNSADKFSFEDCKFRVNKSKEGTGRAVMWMMGIANSFTMEASFGGSTLSTRVNTHFTTSDYEQMGKLFCQTLLDFYDDDPRKQRLRLKIHAKLLKKGSTPDEPTNIDVSDYSSDSANSSSSEEGGGIEYEVSLKVPPSSPTVTKKFKKKCLAMRMRQQLRSPNLKREPLPIYTTTLGLSLSRDKLYTFSDSYLSNSESEIEAKEKSKMGRKKKKKKKRRKNVKRQTRNEHSDTEVQVKNSRVSFLDLLPENKLRSQSWHRSTKLSQIKPIPDVKRSTVSQLAEVQAKLISLRNKLWFGVGDGDLGEPLSWGSSNYYLQETVGLRSQIMTEKIIKKKPFKSEKDKKRHHQPRKYQDGKESQLRREKLIGHRRQATVDLTSTTDTREKVTKFQNQTSCSGDKQKCIRRGIRTTDTLSRCELQVEPVQEVKHKHKEKRKKKSHLEKTAKVVSNAKVFIRRS